MLEKRRLGISRMAQNVGIIGMLIIARNMSKFITLKVIAVLLASASQDREQSLQPETYFLFAGIYKLSCVAPQVRKRIFGSCQRG